MYSMLIRARARAPLRSVTAEKWSEDVKTNKSADKLPEGLFTKSASEIATTLLRLSKDEAQAMQRLQFYINRAGDNLDTADKSRLEQAKKIIQSRQPKD